MAKYTPPPELGALLLGDLDAPLEGGYYDSEDVPAPEPTYRPPAASKFTPERCAIIVDAVRSGAFAHVAASAAGIKPSTLRRWRSDPCVLDPTCATACCDPLGHDARRQFADDLAQAEGQARLSAETRVHAEKPTLWLRIGPGRDRGDPSKPGWTLPPKQVEGKHVHAHAHLHAGADEGGGPRRADLKQLMGKLSASEIAQLDAIASKLLPPGVKSGAIEIGPSSED